MTSNGIALFDRALGEAPDWVHLLPLGQIEARDGRRFVLDNPAALVALFEQGGLDLPIDYEHQTEMPKGKQSGPVPAAGWIKQLQVRADGLWGRVEWTTRARDLIGNREYRYLSPAILFNKTDLSIFKLKGAGLVHSPALHLTALASQEDDMAQDPTFMERLAPLLSKLLGIEADAGEDEILTALQSALAKSGEAQKPTPSQKPDPEKYVPIEAVRDMMRDRKQTAVASSRDRADAKVSKALADGHIIPAMKDWALELCMANEASFDDFVGSNAPAAYSHLLTPTHTTSNAPSYTSDIAPSDEAAAVCAQLGLEPTALGT